MLLQLLAATALAQAPARIVELSRGAVLPAAEGAPSFRYWDTQDTTLDASDPDASRGGEMTLVGGSSRVVLIRFGDLTRVLGQGGRIAKASLFLTVASGNQTQLTSVSRVLVPWGEGPLQTMNEAIAHLSQQSVLNGKTVKAASPRLAATWRSHLAGVEYGNWQQPGARGADDCTPIQGTQLIVGDKTVELTGLGQTFQWMADHPDLNDGIALQFSTDSEFFSGQAADSRPRLELEIQKESRQPGADLAVTSIDRSGDTLTAHVKNIGQAESKGFSYDWSTNGKQGATTDVPAGLAANAAASFRFTPPQRPVQDDHRCLSIGFHIRPDGDDADSTDNDLEVQDGALRLGYRLMPGGDGSSLNPDSVNAWFQRQVRVFNDVYLSMSRYSFAPDGCKERIAVQSTPDADATVDIDPTWIGDPSKDALALKAIASAIGLVDLSRLNIPARSGQIEMPGAEDRGTEDQYAGLMGSGDTRFDGPLLGSIELPSQPSPDPNSASVPLEATGLLSMSEVTYLDDMVGKPIHHGLPGVEPKTIVVRARDYQGQPIAGAKLDFYQSSGWKVPKEAPAASVTLGDSGVGVLPMRPGGLFGSLAPDGSNSLMLIGATLNGITEWSFLKSWQLTDMASRGGPLTGICDLYFDLPGAALDVGTNRALNRIVSDSTGQGVDKLAAAVDGDTKTLAALGSKPGDWVEVDLGRDRTFAEIRISAPESDFWSSFDIVVYGTGQRPGDGLVFAREADWQHTCRTRSDGPADSASVAYRGKPIQFRFIRIISRSGGPAHIGEIEATPTKVAG